MRVSVQVIVKTQALERSLVAHSAASLSLTAGIDTTGANLIVVGCAQNFVAGGPSDNKGNSWVPLSLVRSTNHPHSKAQMFYCINPLVGPGHVFSPGPGGAAAVTMQAFRFLNTPRLGVEASGEASAPPISTGPISVSEPNELLISFIEMGEDASTPQVTHGLEITDTLVGTNGVAYGASMAYGFQAIPGQIPSISWNWNGTQGCVAVATFMAEPIPNSAPLWDNSAVVFVHGSPSAIDLRLMATDPNGDALSFRTVDLGATSLMADNGFTYDQVSFLLKYDGRELGVTEEVPLVIESGIRIEADDGGT